MVCCYPVKISMRRERKRCDESGKNCEELNVAREEVRGPRARVKGERTVSERRRENLKIEGEEVAAR